MHLIDIGLSTSFSQLMQYGTKRRIYPTSRRGIYILLAEVMIQKEGYISY